MQECVGSWSVGGLQRRWIDTMRNCLRKRGSNVRQARSEWQGFVKKNVWGLAQGMNRSNVLIFTFQFCEKGEEEHSVYVGFMDTKKVYDRSMANTEDV